MAKQKTRKRRWKKKRNRNEFEKKSDARFTLNEPIFSQSKAIDINNATLAKSKKHDGQVATFHRKSNPKRDAGTQGEIV